MTILEDVELLSGLDTLLDTLETQEKYSKFHQMFPKEGPYARDKYPKHWEFFSRGKEYPERCLTGGNRTGKTTTGCYELVAHLTGLYPEGWEGKVFDIRDPLQAICLGESVKTVRETLQAELLGPVNDIGTGLIPKDLIVDYALLSGMAGAVDYVKVRNTKNNTISTCHFGTYKRGPKSVKGVKRHIVLMDEDCTTAMYDELLMRTATVDGIMIMTYTATEWGQTSFLFMPHLDPKNLDPEVTISQNMESGEVQGNPRRYLIRIHQDDVPHLDPENMEGIRKSTQPHMRHARTTGMPPLGIGLVYPVAPDTFVINPLTDIPDHWPRFYAMDPGWVITCALFFAYDRHSDTLYQYDEYYAGMREAPIHAEAIKGRGAWLRGVIDPAAGNSDQMDGRKIIARYIDLGLNLTPADNSFDRGRTEVWERLSRGALKITSNNRHTLSEFHQYHQEENGKISHTPCHAMDCLRYACMSGLPISTCPPAEGWMHRGLLSYEERFPKYKSNIAKYRNHKHGFFC